MYEHKHATQAQAHLPAFSEHVFYTYRYKYIIIIMLNDTHFTFAHRSTHQMLSMQQPMRMKPNAFFILIRTLHTMTYSVTFPSTHLTLCNVHAHIYRQTRTKMNTLELVKKNIFHLPECSKNAIIFGPIANSECWTVHTKFIEHVFFSKPVTLFPFGILFNMNQNTIWLIRLIVIKKNLKKRKAVEIERDTYNGAKVKERESERNWDTTYYIIIRCIVRLLPLTHLTNFIRFYCKFLGHHSGHRKPNNISMEKKLL